MLLPMRNSSTLQRLERPGFAATGQSLIQELQITRMMLDLERRPMERAPCHGEVARVIIHFDLAIPNLNAWYICWQSPACPNLDTLATWRDLHVSITETLYKSTCPRLHDAFVQAVIKIDPY